MLTVYNTEEIPQGLPAIFLAGPTPREKHVASWRPAALSLFEAAGFQGAVVVPEDRGFANRTDFDYAGQIDWERDCLARADVVLFWVPRDLSDMPGFTTNIEFGFVSERDQSYVLGYPQDAPKMRYLAHVAAAQKRPILHDLGAAVAAAIEMTATRKTA